MRGAIFDWDGVIINSEEHHRASWALLAEENGRVTSDEEFHRGFGMRNETVIPEVLKWTADPVEVQRLSLRKEELYRQVVRERGIVALPGVEPWLQTLRAAGIPCAIASSTHRANILLSLGMIGLASFFDHIVSGEDVKRGKPDPEVFLLAAEKLGTPPDRSIVFEDALVGIAAAQAAGMRVAAVVTTLPRERLGHADWVVDRLDELTLRGLWGD